MKHIKTFEGFLNEAMDNRLQREIEQRLGIKLELFGSGGSTKDGKYPPSVYQVRDNKNPKLGKGFDTLQLIISATNDSFYFTFGQIPVETSATLLKGKNVEPASMDKLTPNVYQEAREAVEYVLNM